MSIVGKQHSEIRTDFDDGDLFLDKVNILFYLFQGLTGFVSERCPHKLGTNLRGSGQILLQQFDRLLERILHHYVCAQPNAHGLGLLDLSIRKDAIAQLELSSDGGIRLCIVRERSTGT